MKGQLSSISSRGKKDQSKLDSEETPTEKSTKSDFGAPPLTENKGYRDLGEIGPGKLEDRL